MNFTREPEVRKPLVGDLVWYHVAMDVQAAMIVARGESTVTLVVWDSLGNQKQVLGVPQTEKAEPFRWSWRID